MSRAPSKRCWIRGRCVVRDAAARGCARAAAGDKGYRSPTARARMRRRHIRPVIPTRKDQPRQRNFDREAYHLRNKVERLINRLKQARRVATRYEKRGNNYLAMVHIGMILLYLALAEAVCRHSLAEQAVFFF